MTTRGAQSAPPRGQFRTVQPRPIANLALLLAVAAFGGPLGFSLLPGGAPRAPELGTGPWVSSSAAERLGVPRGEVEPRTQMRGKYETGTRSRKNQQGGGNLPIKVNRRPVLAYSMEELPSSDGPPRSEPGWSVLRRAWDMYDMDYNKMVAIRQRYFRPDYRKKRWTADYNMRMGKRKKDLRIKRQYETEWLEWMRRRGRQLGLTEPIVYNGPTVPYGEDKLTDLEKQVLAGNKEAKAKYKKFRLKHHKYDWIPEDVLPGKWNDDGPDNVFKVWRRPLCKWPFDVGKRGKKRAVHGQVL